MDKQQCEEEEEEVDMMEGVSSGENEEEGGEGLNEAEEKVSQHQDSHMSIIHGAVVLFHVVYSIESQVPLRHN